jgi:hypothetical protein
MGKDDILVDGESFHTRSIYSVVGTNKMKDVKEYFEKRNKKVEKVEVKAKARYIYILGDKRERRKALKKLKLKVYDEYPKNYGHELRLEEKYNKN